MTLGISKGFSLTEENETNSQKFAKNCMKSLKSLIFREYLHGYQTIFRIQNGL